MLIDSDTEEWPVVGLASVKKVDWPADAPTSCRLLIVQPMAGPLSLSSATDLGKARIHVESRQEEEEKLQERHARRMPIVAVNDDIVMLFCDAIIWQHADTLMAGRLIARFSPKQVILADFIDTGSISAMTTSHAVKVDVQTSVHVARGLPAALLSICEIRNVPAYYLTHEQAIDMTMNRALNDANAVLNQVSTHTGIPAVKQLLFGKQAQPDIAHDNLYI
ncbi:hypothetical protein BDF19DRAFT_443822 [Syncephalis fuscata]|nr:hypothetical protein BDF19DRAFT_443822 [Syncephalis fuscata]